MQVRAAVKMTKLGKPDRRVMRRENHISDLVKYMDKPRTVQECADELGVNVRAVYLLFGELNGRGQTVARIGPKAGARYTLI